MPKKANGWQLRASLSGVSRENLATSRLGGSDCDSDLDDDADLAEELMLGMETGADTAVRVMRLAKVANNKLRKHGITDKHLKLMAKCGKSKADPHACSNLHRLLQKTGRMLDVKISTIPLWEWYDVKGAMRAVTFSDTNPSPFKDGSRSPLRDLLMGECTPHQLQAEWISTWARERS